MLLYLFIVFVFISGSVVFHKNNTHATNGSRYTDPWGRVSAGKRVRFLPIFALKCTISPLLSVTVKI